MVIHAFCLYSLLCVLCCMGFQCAKYLTSPIHAHITHHTGEFSRTWLAFNRKMPFPLTHSPAPTYYHPHTFSLPLTHLHTHHNTHRAAILTCLIGCFTVFQMHGDQPVKPTWLMWKSLFQSSSISLSSWWTATTLISVCALPNVAVPHRNLIIPSHISTAFILHSAIVLNFN